AGRVVGIDLSNEMLSMGRARCTGLPWVELGEADAVSLPFPKATFDAAVASQVYEYVGDLARALAEARRVLRPGGRLLVPEAEVAAWVADLRELGAADNYFFSLNRYLFLARNG